MNKAQFVIIVKNMIKDELEIRSVDDPFSRGVFCGVIRAYGRLANDMWLETKDSGWCALENWVRSTGAQSIDIKGLTCIQK